MQRFENQHQQAFKAIVPSERFSVGESNLDLHRQDISPFKAPRPAGIIWPTSTEEVSRILGYCHQAAIAVTAWGAGTSTEGNPVPIHGGLVMDFTHMDQVLAVRPHDLQADVQPGVTRKNLNRRLGQHGLFFPPDPGADATIGGMIANNASGVQTVKYGATRDYVLRLTVVLADGRVIQTGTRAPKSSSGYDLTRLFVGSEGTLGIVTEATLKLAGRPSHHLVTTVVFDELAAASEAVALLMGSGLQPAALELLPPALIRLMNREQGLGLPEQPALFCEFHGISDSMLVETAALARELCEDCGAVAFRSGVQEAERQALWRARHEAWETIHRAHPGHQTIIVDAAVPISHYPEMITFAQQLVDQNQVAGYVFGHAGDGNLHVVMPGDPVDEKQWQVLESINERIVTRAIELGGTCTGEHGVGIGKRRFMPLEHGEAYGLMRSIKNLLDPKGILNPGKMFLD